MQEFKKFKELFTSKDIKTSKKYNAGLEKEALEWFKQNFGATFGSTTRCDTKDIITWHYSCGMLSFGVPPMGDYYYNFIIQMVHFEFWKTKEWKEGFKYGLYCGKSKMKLSNKNYRDANPYPDWNFYSSDAWDAGYIMGLSKFSFKKKVLSN